MSYFEKIVDIVKNMAESNSAHMMNNTKFYNFKRKFVVSVNGDFSYYGVYPVNPISSREPKLNIEIKRVKYNGREICPYMKFTARGPETLEDVAKRMYFELKDWHVDYLVKYTPKREKMEYLLNNNWKPLWTDDYWVVANRPYTDWSGIPLNRAFYSTKAKELYNE